MTAASPVPELQVAPVLAPSQGVWHEVRAIKVVWKRDLIRFRNERARIFSSLMQPLLWSLPPGGRITPPSCSRGC